MSGRARALVALFVALDVALAALLAFAIHQDRMAEASRRDALAVRMGATALDEAARDELYAQAVGEALKRATLDSEPVARDGEVRLNLENGADSAYALTLTLARADGGSPLLETGLVEPGYRLEAAALDTALDPGVYQCLARFTFYGADDGVCVGSAVRLVLLRVL